MEKPAKTVHSKRKKKNLNTESTLFFLELAAAVILNRDESRVKKDFDAVQHVIVLGQ